MDSKRTRHEQLVRFHSPSGIDNHADSEMPKPRISRENLARLAVYPAIKVAHRNCLYRVNRPANSFHGTHPSCNCLLSRWVAASAATDPACSAAEQAASKKECCWMLEAISPSPASLPSSPSLNLCCIGLFCIILNLPKSR